MIIIFSISIFLSLCTGKEKTQEMNGFLFISFFF